MLEKSRFVEKKNSIPCTLLIFGNTYIYISYRFPQHYYSCKTFSGIYIVLANLFTEIFEKKKESDSFRLGKISRMCSGEDDINKISGSSLQKPGNSRRKHFLPMEPSSGAASGIPVEIPARFRIGFSWGILLKATMAFDP